MLSRHDDGVGIARGLHCHMAEDQVASQEATVLGEIAAGDNRERRQDVLNVRRVDPVKVEIQCIEPGPALSAGAFVPCEW